MKPFESIALRVVRFPAAALFALVMLLGSSMNLSAGDAKTADEFVRILNQMRADPSSFIKKIDEYANDWRSFVPNRKTFDKAIKEAKAVLRTAKPLPPLTVDSKLVDAAIEHANDARKMGVLGHIGSDGSNPFDRLKRHTNFESVGEVITYGQSGAADMLAAFIVDHDTPDRGHRKSLMSTEYTSIGVAVDSHPKMRTQCVAVLAKNPK